MENNTLKISDLYEKLKNDRSGKVAKETIDQLAVMRQEVQQLQNKGLDAQRFGQSEAMKQAVNTAIEAVEKFAH